MKYLFEVKKENRSLFFRIIPIMIYAVFYLIAIGLVNQMFKSINIYIDILIVCYFIYHIVPFTIYPSWKLTDEKIDVYIPTTSFEKWIYIFKKSPNLSINYKEINKICISYRKTSALFIYQEAYVVYFDIYLKDGNEISIDSMLNYKVNNFLKAVNYVKSKNVVIDDPYKILLSLEKNESLYAHLKGIEVKKYD